MKQTKAPHKTPSPTGVEAKPDDKVGTTDNPSQVFVSMTLDMSWRLAIVVLVPIVGGFELDQHLRTSALFIIIGFVAAMIGVVMVLRQMLQAINQPLTSNKEKHS